MDEQKYKKLKHDFNGGFESIKMALEIVESELQEEDLKSLINLSLQKTQELKQMSLELVDRVNS